MAGSLSVLLELRRRKVFRGIGYYLVGAWTLLEVVELIAEPVGLPSWSLTALLYLAVVGFPLAVWVSWRYELSDHGLVRTRPATAEDAQADYSLKTSDYIIFGAMIAVIGAVAWQGLGSIRSEAVEAEAVAERAAEAQREALENSVAVLPFSDLSRSADQGFLGDGIADTVLHVLSQVDGLTVTARTSSFAFRDRDMTISEIANQLGVAHILEGSVQRAGEQLRIIARLVDGASGAELWSGNFDRGQEEIFAIQDEIAREVVASLGVTVLADDRERLEDEYRPDMEAYEQYVVGRRELDTGSADGVASAIRRFEKAIEIDPDYALAHVALASALQSRGVVKQENVMQTMQRVSELVEHALELDPTLAEAWNLKAMLQAFRKDFEGSGKSIERALELNPNSAEAWAGYWNYLLLMNRQEEALAAIRKAVELDPESVQYKTSLAQQLFNLSRAEEAIYTLRQAIERHPNNTGLYQALARYLTQVGSPGEAMWYLQTVHRRDPGNVNVLKEICIQHWQLWDDPAALDCFDRYIEAAPQDLDGQKWRAGIAGDYEEAVRIAEIEVERQPQFWYPKMQLADYLALTGDWERIIEVVSSAFPDLMTDEPQLNDWKQWGARRLAEALLRSGRTEQAELLIQATLTHFERSRKLQAGGWMAGPEDAQLYALLGDHESALESLEKAIVRDWMFFARALIEDTPFNALREDPRFVALVDRLAQNMAEERAWYEEHKDDLVL